MLDQRPGFLLFRAEGPDAAACFANEAGGHRWQRVPPNDKRGRVQTSTVTVAVLEEVPEAKVALGAGEVQVRYTRGSGPGGQARNKTESCVVATHLPTGITVRVDTERSQKQNLAFARALLRSRLAQRQSGALASERNAARRGQIGSGMRGDKRRTVRCQDGLVVDHVLGRRLRLDAYEKGCLEGFMSTEA